MKFGYDSTKPYKDRLVEIVRSTWDSPYLKVDREVTGATAFLRTHGAAYEIDHTDGIGTKGELHWHYRTFGWAAQDAFAMNWNDLQALRSVPFKLQNHLMVPADDHEAILEIVQELANLCVQLEVVLTGGETSIHWNLSGMELGVTMSGLRGRGQGNNVFNAGDDIVGLPSSGMHSNGFTRYAQVFPVAQQKREHAFPTTIYDLHSVWPFVNGIVHMAGGAFTRLKPLLNGTDAVLWPGIAVPPIMHELCERGVPPEEMYKTFNCGVGMTLSVPKVHTAAVVAATGGTVIGHVVAGTGRVIVNSWLGGGIIEY